MAMLSLWYALKIKNTFLRRVCSTFGAKHILCIYNNKSCTFHYALSKENHQNQLSSVCLSLKVIITAARSTQAA